MDLEQLGIKQVGDFKFRVNGKRLKLVYPKVRPDGEVIYANIIYPLERVLDNGYILWTGQTSKGWVEIGIEFPEEGVIEGIEFPAYLYVFLKEKKWRAYFPLDEVAGRRLPDVMKEAFQLYEEYKETDKIFPDDIEDL